MVSGTAAVTTDKVTRLNAVVRMVGIVFIKVEDIKPHAYPKWAGRGKPNWMPNP
jgi:hypothetical protein